MTQSARNRSATQQQDLYTIGKAAELAGVSAKMIRHYESLGLIAKAPRTASDYRLYSSNDLHTLRFIRRARGLGFSIEEIKALLGLWRNQRRASAEVKRLAAKHLEALDRRIAELQSMRATLQELVASCHGDARAECPILDDLSD